MNNKQRLEEIDRYIEKYYVPGYDDIDLEDDRIKGFFDRITDFLSKRKKEAGRNRTESGAGKVYDKYVKSPSSTDRPAFDMTVASKETYTRPMSEVTIGNRKIDALMDQMDETFSQRLVRMIKERNMSEAQAYKKAHVDRRHFSKIKKDEFYTPNKKTVLAFAIALELSLDETKDLLRSAGYALSRSSKFDIIIVYFLENQNYNLFDINEVLYEYDQPIFE